MKKKTKYMIIIVIVLIIILFSIYGFTYAKYATKSIWNYYLESNGFYFSSNLLNTDEISHVNNNWDGTNIIVSIKNSDNNVLITNYNISYKAKCSVINDNTKKCNINDTNSSIYTGTLRNKRECSFDKNLTLEECINAGYEMRDVVATDDISFSIKNNDGTDLTDQSDVSIQIEVDAMSPYSKKLYGNFYLHKNINAKDGITEKIIDDSDNIKYIISNYTSSDKCLKVNWNATDLKIDADTDDVLSYQVDENNYINEITIDLLDHMDVNYIFYKSNSEKKYDLSSFVLTELSSCE